MKKELGEFVWPEDFAWPESHSDSMIYLGLCHDAGMLASCGIEIEYDKEDYAAAKAALVAEGVSVCFEDVLFRIVEMGNLWKIYDSDNEEYLDPVGLKELRANIRNMPVRWWFQFIERNDDGETANVALQYALFGDCIYG
jgi:hypothetical protein